MTDLTVHLLGPVRASVDGRARPLSSHRQRALLAALALRDGRSVSVGELVDALWEEEPPDRARTTLQTYVSRLRSQLGEHAIVHHAAGYRLGDDVAIDLTAARRWANEARGRLALDPLDAARRCRQALDLWAGPSLGDLAELAWFEPHAFGLDELRRSLEELWAEAMIRAGEAPAAIEHLEAATRADPWREPAQALLVRALHEAGRTVEALRVADRYRRQLREETGLDPGAVFVAAEAHALSGEQHVPRELPRPTPATTLARPGRLIGRDDDLGTLDATARSNRLVTVVGPGGVGKTRLVAEWLAAPEAPPSTVVELAPVAPGAVLAAAAAALGHRAERVGTADLATIVGRDDLVLVLDNAEHVVEEVALLVRVLLDRCPQVRVLVTSRTRLGLADEQVQLLRPLPAEGSASPAVELFCERARRAGAAALDAEDPALQEICHRLDGVPLALELAASRASVLGVEAVRARLDDALDVIAAGTEAAGRHTSLRSVVQWSFDLLGVPEQRLLGVLAHFEHEFDLDAAEQVGGAVLDQPVSLTLGRLVDASLVAPTGAPGHYRLLEMIRQHARAQPVEGELARRAARAHTAWVAGRLRAIEHEHESSWSTSLDQLRADLHRALDAADPQADAADVEALVGPLASLLVYRPDADLLERGLTAVVTAADGATPLLLASAARLAYLVGDHERSRGWAERALRSPSAPAAARHRACHALGVTRLYEADFLRADEAFSNVLGDDPTVVDRLDALGGACLARCYRGDLDATREALAEHEALARALGSLTYEAFAEYVRAELLLAAGDVEGATADLQRSTDHAWQAGATFVGGIASTVLAAVLVRHRPAAEALEHLPGLVDRWRRSATWTQLWTTLRLVAELLVTQGDPATAALVLGAADRDPAAPLLTGADLARRRQLHDLLSERLGASALQGIEAAAAELDRAEVLARAVHALTAAAR